MKQNTPYDFLWDSLPSTGESNMQTKTSGPTQDATSDVFFAISLGCSALEILRANIRFGGL